MFRRPIVFVVGAGASFDYGMPLGSDLVEKIASDTNFWFEHHVSTLPTRGDKSLFECLRRRCPGDNERLNQYMRAGQLLASVLTSVVSIDDALYQLNEVPEAVELGKTCILRTIWERESKGALRIPSESGTLPRDAGKNGWIEQVFSMAISGLRRGEIREKAFARVTFLNFNYDRCIEHYIYWALLRQGLPKDEAESTVKELTIVRPYGGLGTIFPGSTDHLPFGQYDERRDFSSDLGRIRTYTESDAIHDPQLTERLISNAAMFVFLGFGFHRQNLDLIRVNAATGFRFVHVLATVFGIHAANRKTLGDALESLLKAENTSELLEMTAAEMLQKLRLKIMMAVG